MRVIDPDIFCVTLQALPLYVSYYYNIQTKIACLSR